MSRDDETLFFFDPFNNRRIEVPAFKEGYGFTTLSFFNPPTSPNCFIIGIKSGSIEVKIGFLRHGDNEWNIDHMEHIEITKALQFRASLAPPILHSGKLYFLDVRGKVATLDVSEDRLSDGSIAESGYIFRKCLEQRRLRRNIKEHYLVKPMGEDAIFAIFLMNDDRKVKVFRLLEPDMRWELVDDLGDMVFYVSNASSFGYRTCNKSLKNKIFFTRFHDEKVVFYSLYTKKYHSFGGNYSSKGCYGFKSYDHATWMMLAPTPHLSPESLTWCPQEQGSH